MGIKKISIINKHCDERYSSYVENILSKDTVKDRNLEKEMINEINSYGYQIYATYQLEWMDKEDFDIINPIIMKYAGKFDRQLINSAMYTYLAVKGNYQAVDYLINEFKKPNTKYDNDIEWNWSRRGSASCALEVISDTTRYKEYIELALNPDTADDSYLIIELLGKIKKEECYKCLLKTIKSKKYDIRANSIRNLAKFTNHKDELKTIFAKYENDENEVVREAVKIVYKKWTK